MWTARGFSNFFAAPQNAQTTTTRIRVKQNVKTRKGIGGGKAIDRCSAAGAGMGKKPGLFPPLSLRFPLVKTRGLASVLSRTHASRMRGVLDAADRAHAAGAARRVCSA